MDLTWLMDFLALNQSRSFSRAADQRHLTQPAFSRRIQALERWAGSSLFERGSRAVTLTESGRRFLPWAEVLLHQVDQARAEVRAGLPGTADPLRIAATHSLSLSFFSRWIGAVRTPQSLGAVELASECLEGCERLLAEGKAQFLLAHCHPGVLLRLDSARFTSVSVGGDVLVPVASPQLALELDERGTSVHAAPFIGYSDQSGLGRILQHALGGLVGGMVAKPTFTAHHAGVLKAMACEGRGLAWLPRAIIHDELARRDLVELDARWAIPLDIRLFRPKLRLCGKAEVLWAAVLAPGEDDVSWEPRCDPPGQRPAAPGARVAQTGEGSG